MPGGFTDFDTAVRSAMRTAQARHRDAQPRPDECRHGRRAPSSGSLATQPDSTVVPLARPARLAAADARLPGRVDGALRRHRGHAPRRRSTRTTRPATREGRNAYLKALRHQPRPQHRVERPLLARPQAVGGRRGGRAAHARARPTSPAAPGRSARAPASPCRRMPRGAVSRPRSRPRSPAATADGGSIAAFCLSSARRRYSGRQHSRRTRPTSSRTRSRQRAATHGRGCVRRWPAAW